MDQNLVERWRSLAARYVEMYPGVEHGKMMSAEALTWRGKVFVFLSTKGGRIGLGCRLGRDFNVAALNLDDWQHLAPFKTKPPMKDWIVAGGANLNRWDELTKTALELTQNRKA